ncbi:type I-E CRISPR-associated protein Cse2/CasB [Streptomyces luteireticuli]|uniref:CRISPR-associated protein Cse2 n=1 Tax=Streptomyces luteireticuli TaxID=173858 RepID=A0ABN0Z981_9ACTN
MPTLSERRRHYEAFTAHATLLCTDPGVRRALRDGRGRPVEDCLGLHRHLTRHTAGHGARRAHYTVASLIALADPPTPRPPTEPHPTPEHPAPAAPGALTTTPAPTPGDPPPPPSAADTGTNNPDPYRSSIWRCHPNLGTTLATAVRRAGYNESRTEETLHLLVRLGDDQLHRRLPSLTKRLLDDGLTPRWPVLLDDLAQRTYDRNPVGTRWLDAFYLTLDATVKGPM